MLSFTRTSLPCDGMDTAQTILENQRAFETESSTTPIEKFLKIVPDPRLCRENSNFRARNCTNPLVANGVDYFCGVPDSVTGPFSHFLEDHASKDRHVITANEGNAIGLAIGYHIATGKIPLVYMQNSGLSNAIDPLASLADTSVFKHPDAFACWLARSARQE